MSNSPTLAQGPIGSGLLKFSLPIAGMYVILCLNISANAVWVGRSLGEVALTATANANTVVALLAAMAFSTAVAATIMVGHATGRGDITGAKRIVGAGVTFFAATSIVVTVIALFSCKQILLFMKTPPESLPMAVTYMRALLLELPFVYVGAFIIATLRGWGDARTAFYCNLLAAITGIVLNPLFILGVGPIPGLGIGGSGLATVVAQAVSMLALVVVTYRRSHPLSLRGADLALVKLDPTVVGPLLRKGLPMSAQAFVLSGSNIAMISLVNRFGVDTTAAFGASLQLWNYTQVPAIALSMGVSTMVAQSVGAGAWGRVPPTARTGILYSVILTSALVGLIELFGAQAYGLFLPHGSPALEIGRHINAIAGPSFILYGIAVVVFGVVRATGTVMVPLLLLTLAMFGIRYPFALSFISSWKADAIWWSFCLSSGVAAVLAYLHYSFGPWSSGRDETSPSIFQHRSMDR